MNLAAFCRMAVAILSTVIATAAQAQAVVEAATSSNVERQVFVWGIKSSATVLALFQPRIPITVVLVALAARWDRKWVPVALAFVSRLPPQFQIRLIPFTTSQRMAPMSIGATPVRRCTRCQLGVAQSRLWLPVNRPLMQLPSILVMFIG